MKEKMHKLFYVWQGYQITDEEIYNSEKGQFPILTSHNVIKGTTNIPHIDTVPCITLPSKGLVNKLYLQEKPFDANNTIVLTPRDRTKIDLEYFVYTKSDYLTSFISSKYKNNYLNKEILNNIEIEYPDPIIQTEIKNKYKKLVCLKEKIQNCSKLLVDQLDIHMEIQGDPKIIDNVFFLTTGSDDALTEKYAYENKGDVPIYSGATDNNGIFRYVNRIDYNPIGEYVTWAISGRAGTLYIRKGSCCLTRHCGMMIPKNKDEINLEWFVLSQEKKIQEFALAKEGLGELKKIRIKLFPFMMPSRPIQDKIVKEYRKLIELKTKLQKINSQIQYLLNDNVVI